MLRNILNKIYKKIKVLKEWKASEGLKFLERLKIYSGSEVFKFLIYSANSNSYFSFFLLLQSFFLNFAFSMLHMSQMTQMSQMSHMGMCGWQVCMDMNGYEWLRMGVPGWVCVGVYVTNFQNTYWRLDS